MLVPTTNYTLAKKRTKNTLQKNTECSINHIMLYVIIFYMLLFLMVLQVFKRYANSFKYILEWIYCVMGIVTLMSRGLSNFEPLKQ